MSFIFNRVKEFKGSSFSTICSFDRSCGELSISFTTVDNLYST